MRRIARTFSSRRARGGRSRWRSYSLGARELERAAPADVVRARVDDLVTVVRLLRPRAVDVRGIRVTGPRTRGADGERERAAALERRRPRQRNRNVCEELGRAHDEG